MKTILIVAIGFLPNIGGLETHLKDLIDELLKDDWRVIVLTYQPLHTPVLGKWVESSKNLRIYRLPSIRGLFYRLLKIPLLEFIFLEPFLFVATPLVLLMHPTVNIINAQGIIAGFSVAFWKKIFRKRYVISAQSVYHFPRTGLYRQICKWIFKSADKVVAISGQTKKDIETLDVSSNKIVVYTNWENSNFFKPQDKIKAKRETGLANKFVISFFGRLVEEKGIELLIEAVKLSNRKITFAIYGEGPLVDYVKHATERHKNILYMGTILPTFLPLHYNAADLIIMPSLHEEGFGRVAAGALFCGTPVVASNRGALPEVVNERVGKIINPTAQEIAKTVNFYYSNPKALRKCAENAGKYARSKFSSKNSQNIIYAFEDRI